MKQTFTFYKKGKINSLKSFNSLLRKESDERKVRACIIFTLLFGVAPPTFLPQAN